MENKKDDKNYNNESYLDKRTNPDDSKNADMLDEIENKTEKDIDFSKENSKIKPIENISDNESENQQKEMHPEIRKKKNKDLTIPLILGIVILMVIGIVAVYFLIDKKDIGKKENPQQIIKSSMQAMQKAKTYNYDGIMEFNISNEKNSDDFNFEMEFSGKADQTDLNNIKSSDNIKIKIDASGKGNSQEFSFDLETAQHGQEKIYFKLNDFDLGMLGMVIGPEINSFKGVWYKWDLEELEKLSAASSFNNISGMSIPNYDINKIMVLYNKYELLKFEEDLGITNIVPTTKWAPPETKGVDTYHYKVKLDGIALANFYMDIMEEVMVEIDMEDDNKTFNEEFSETIREIRENIEKYDYLINKVTDNVDVEIWIGKDDKLIYGTKICGEFDEEFIEMIKNEIIVRGDVSDKDATDKLNKDISFKFNIDIRMRDFNKPVEIDEPEEAENFMEILEKMSKEFKEIGFEETDIDGDRLSNKAESFYGTDPNNPDTDGDGYTDGEEVASGYDPLIPGNAKLDYDKLFKM